MSSETPFDGPEALWREGLLGGRFLIQRCDACDNVQFPPVTCCQVCGQTFPPLVEAQGSGTVYSTTTVRSRGGDYDVSIIKLDEGPHMMSRVEGIAPDAVCIGMGVRAEIVGEGEPVVVFRPKEDSE